MTMADITEGTDEGTKLDGKYYYFDLDKIVMKRDNVKGSRPMLDESKTLNEREGNKMSIEQRVISVLDELHYLEKIGEYSYIYCYDKVDYRDKLEPETIDNLIASAKSGDLTEAWYDLISSFEEAGYIHGYIFNEVVEALEKVAPLTDEEFDAVNFLLWDSIQTDYSTYLDDEVPVYIMVDTGDGNYDFTLNPNYSFNWDGETIEDEPLELASLTWLAGTQGYTLDQVLEAFREGGRNNKFLNSVVREGLNNSTSMSAVTFLGTMRILDLLNAASGNGDVVINADTYVGLFDTWSGSGSLFDIELEQDLVIPGNIINRIGTARGGGDNGYTPDQVYGFSGSVYDSKINLLNDLDRDVLGESKNFVGDNIKSEVHDKMVREFKGSTLNKSHIEGIVKEILEDIVDDRINIKINYQRARNRAILLAIIHATGIKNKFQFRFTLKELGQDRVKVEKVETIIVDAKDSLTENVNETFYLIISTLWNEWFGVINNGPDYYALDGLVYADYAKDEAINHFIRLNKVPTEDEVIDFYINHEAGLNQVMTRNREIFDNLLDEVDINLMEENELEVISFNREELVEYLKSYGLDAFTEDVVEGVARHLDDELILDRDLTENKALTEGLINTREFIDGVNNSRKDYYEKTIRFFGGGGVIITLTSLIDLYVTDMDTNETVKFATLETHPSNKYDWGWELRDKLLDLEIILSRSTWREELNFKNSKEKGDR